MRKLGLTVVTAMLLLGSAVAPAPGAPTAAPFAKVEDFSGDLQIVGSGLAWKDVRCLSDCARFPFEERERARYLLKRPGQRSAELARTRLTTIPGGSNSVIEAAHFAASSTRTLMVVSSERNVDDQLSTSATVFAGRPGSSPPELFECEGAFELPVSLDADLLAFDETRCVTGSTDVVVRSLADGSVRRVPTGDRRIEALALAGDRLAVLSYGRLAEGTSGHASGELAVWDLQTLTKLVSVPAGTSVAPPAFALRPDGALAFVTFDETAQPDNCQGTLSLLGPAEGTPQTLGTGMCKLVDFAGDQVLAQHRRTLVAITPAGVEHALLNLGRVELRAAAADGTSVAYALRTCDGDATLYRVVVSAPAADAGAPRCPLRIATQSAHVGPTRHFRVRVVSRRGSAGFMELRRNGATILEKPFERRAGRRSVRLRLTGSLMRQLLRQGSLRVGIRTVTTERAGDELRHRQTVTLMPAG
jgi:hypothetical protein